MLTTAACLARGINSGLNIIAPPSLPFSVGGLFILCFDLHNLK
nr:MAG TPA: hypothetical protein [Caudoviricetes sp.]